MSIKLGYIIALAEDRVIAVPDSRVYVKQLPKKVYKKYFVYRPEKLLSDPNNKKKILGIQTAYIGQVTPERLGDPATFIVTEVDKEMLKGDRLLPAFKQKLPQMFHLRPPKRHVKGRILSVIDGYKSFGQSNIVAINLGKRQGLRPGDVLAIYNKEYVKQLRQKHMWSTKPMKLPSEHNGEIIVFKTFAQVSYGLVMHTRREARIMDIVTNP